MMDESDSSAVYKEVQGWGLEGFLKAWNCFRIPIPDSSVEICGFVLIFRIQKRIALSRRNEFSCENTQTGKQSVPERGV